jgi:threonine dehydratase
MADPSTCLPLTPSSITTAHEIIRPYIHRTPLLTSATLNEIASSPNPAAYLSESPPNPDSSTSTNGTTTSPTSHPKFSLHFKSEHLQKIGAFKARGAFHALSHLISQLTLPVVRARGVTTHSSGNHAQALALAAHTFGVPSYIVMPRISTESKIAGTRRYATEVVFSGSTSQEREEVVARVVRERGSVVVPPYDHVDIVLGQGTVGREVWEQFKEGEGSGGKEELDLVVAPIGGGGLLGGIATWFGDKKTKVIGAEPSFEGADDARRGLEQGQRIEVVKSLTIADGLRTPVGQVNWEIVSDKSKVEAVYSVTEEEIKMAMRLVWERMKCVVEPSGCVALAVVLFNKEFREWVAGQQKEGETWDVAVVFSGGNTTMKAVSALFGEGQKTKTEEREEGKVGADGKRVAENVAG